MAKNTVRKQPESVAGKKTLTLSSIRGIVALVLWFLVFMMAGWLFPAWRSIAWSSFYIFLFIAILLAVVVCVNYFVRNNNVYPAAVSAYNTQCDPRPMLAECERRLTKRMTKSVQPRWLIQQAMALFDLGEFEQGIRLLEAMLSTKQRLSDEVCAVCFMNLAEAAFSLVRIVEAISYHNKAAACIQRIKSEKTQQALHARFYEQEGTLLYYTGDYLGAKRIFLALGWDDEQIDAAQTPCSHVFKAYKLGLVLLKTGDIEPAREKLIVVAERGNQLYIVEQAKRVLRQIEQVNQPEV